MITDVPDPLEVIDFRFRQMRKLCMNTDEEGIPGDAINLVATSSRYGLVFVGVEEGFKVLKLENIFDLNEDEEKRKDAKEFPYQKVDSPTPCLLALSADDMTLAVCVTRDSCAVADMYDIRAFADQEEMPVPFTSVRLSSDNNVKLRDLMWNPVVVEMYAFCLTDGSMYVHELAETNLKIAANLPPQTNASAVCWSPKGKEVVVGKKNGSFSRFKPTLQEVKNFPPPAGLYDNGVEVVSIYWISTTLFAVVYVPTGDSDDKLPSLVFASTPKGADVTYSNFGDVCFGGICDREPRYIMHYDPEWKILVCVSSNAIESAVVGCIGNEKPIWQQWMLDDSGRADVPLVRNAEPSPLGMAVIYCAQRKIIVSDTETYPPMPVLFLLSTSGLLCPFHVLNTQPGAGNLVYPSEPICREGERKQKGNGKAQPMLNFQKSSSPLTPGSNLIKTVQPQGDTVPTNNNNNVIPPVSSVSANNASVLPAPNTTVQKTAALGSMQNIITPQANSFSFVSNQNSQKTLPASKTGPSLTFGSTKPPSVSPSPQTFAAVKPLSVIASSGATLFQTQSSVTQASSAVSSAEQSSKKFAVSTVSQPAIQAVTTPNSQLLVNSVSGSQKPLEAVKAPESSWLTESTITNAVLEEIAEFNRELKELKDQSSKFDGQIGTKEEMAYLKKSSVSLIEFHQKMNLAVETLSSEIHSLKNMVLESFAMLSEAESQEKRLKDPKYLSMLRDRALDPRSAKQMQKIQQLNQYLSTQLSEVNDKLDNDWHEFVQQQKNDKRKGHKLPSAEAIYRTIVSNQNIIYNQKAQLERMNETLSKRRREGQLRGIKLFHNPKIEISDGELGKLADALLQTKINSNDGKVGIEHITRKAVSPHKQAALRELLANRRVTTVKPTVIYSPSQSRLCSRLPVHVRTPEKPPAAAVDTQKEDEKLENGEHPVKESMPENIPPPFHQEVSAVPPFTAKPATVESKGGITQGIPVAKTVSKPTPSMIPSQAINAGIISAAFKIQNGTSEPSSSSLLTKNASQSAFTHLVPSASKPVQESPKLLPQNNAGKPLFMGQNFFQQKQSSNSSFVSVSNIRPGPERSFVPAFTLSETKESGNVNSAFASSSLQASSTSPDPESLGTCVYEDISPPDSPSPAGDESVTDQLSLQTLTRKSASELPTVQPVSEEKLVTKPASFFFSPVDERKSTVAPVPQKDIPQSQGDISSQKITAKGTEISSAGSPPVVPITSSDEYTQTGSITTSTNQQIQSSTPSQSISSTLPAFVSSTVSSSIVPTTQIMVSSSVDLSTGPSVLVVQSPSSVNQKENIGITTQAEPPLASAKLSASATASSALPSASPSLQPNFGKVAAFAFALPKDLNNQKEVKNADTGATTSTAPSSVSSNSAAASGDSSAVVQSGDEVAEKSATLQKTGFGSKPSATVTSSATVFEQPPPITSTVPSNTPPTRSVFGQAAQVNTGGGSGGTFGVIAVTQPSSVFGQKTVTTAATTSTVSTTATTTTASTISFFGQQSTFFGKTTLTSPVFGQAPPAQSSVFGQTVNNASTPAFGQTGTNSFFNQTAATGTGAVFGQKPQSPGSSSAFGQSTGASGFSFQKASMEQQNSSSFGLTKSVFGQNPVFGQQQNTTSSPFGQSPSSSSSSSGGGIFGQGSFFSGLGGKPSEENASKNVFASTISSPSTNNSIFGNQGASSFGSKLGGSFSGGSFSSGSGSVAQSGFGAFQQTPQKTSGFGAPPSFGGSPTFGNSPNFGGSPTFGSGMAPGSPLGSSTFGSPQGEGFGSFASSNSPTFGTLASQTGGFGGGTQQQPPTFGSLSPQSPPPSAFGAGSPVFGGPPGFGAQSSFGSPTGATQSSAFSQWRN